MLGRKIATQIGLFLVVALVGVSVIAVRYVHIPRLLGISGYTVVLDLPDTGGAYTDAAVSYRGVSVGRVGDIRLTKNGVEADLDINGDAPQIPADLVAVVANRSAIGEQYVDLQPRTDSSPYLQAGSRLSIAGSTLPIPVASLLGDVDRFVRSVPRKDLVTTVDELNDATIGSGQDLQTLIDAGRKFTRAASDNYGVTKGLIDNSATVLATQQRSSGNITSFSTNLSQVANQLQSSDGDLRTLIGATPGAATEVKALIDQVGGPLGVLMGNLVTTSQVLSANAAGLQGVYVRLPAAVSAAENIVGPDGLKVGLATTFFDPLPCTNGYAATSVRPPTDIQAGKGLNTAASCVPTSAGSDVRGSAAAVQAAAAARPPAVSVTTVSTLGDLLGGAG